MFTLLSPAGLWALTALSLPLAIHLWHRPPRTIRLGSLRFLETLPRRLHDLRWRERWLLAVRLVLLALLALLLAGPRWQRPPPTGARRWLLLDPNAVPAGSSLDRLRALQAAGYETRRLAPGFPFVSSGREAAAGPVPDVWSLLREAEAELPPGSALAVFSPGRLTSLRGSRPAMQPGRVDWIETPDTPVATLPVPGTAGVTPPPLQVLVLSDAERAADAHYVAAALRAAAEVSGRPITVKTAAAGPVPSAVPGWAWLFWLSAQPVPPSWLESGANIVSEAGGLPDDGPSSWLVAAPDAPGATALASPFRLWRRVAPPAGAASAVEWTDGFGQPLLTVSGAGRGRHWRFFGRFDPTWTDLPLSSAFPAWLRALLWQQGDKPRLDPARDRRLADPAQCRPADTSNAKATTLLPAGESAVDLHGFIWTLAAVLFGLERLLSSRRRPSGVAVAQPERATANLATAR